MGFDVVYVADIQQFPRPLYPKFKHNFRPGCRLDVPAVIGDFFIEVDYLFPAVTLYELIYVVVALTGYKDGDSWSLHWNDKVIFNDVYFKEYPERKHLQPVRRFDPKTDVLRFVFHNKTGTSKVLWADFECACRAPIGIEEGIRIPTITPFLALLINPPSGKYKEWFNCTIQYNSPCNIWYTMDESDPTTDGTCIPYNGPFLINGPCVVKAIGNDIFGNTSSIVRADYDIEVPVEPLWVIANPSGGEYPNSLYIVLFANLPSVIYFTTDETEPDLNSETYLNPILLKETTTVKFFAVSDDGQQVTDVVTEVYVLEQGVTPPIDPPVDPPISADGYLRMFVVTDTSDPNYVDPNSINTNDYWHDGNGNKIQFNVTGAGLFSVDKEFYKGRNDQLAFFKNIGAGNGQSVSINNFYRYLFKLYKDSKSGLSLPEISGTYEDSMNYMNGIGITDLAQKLSIYTTYKLKVVNIVHNRYLQKLGGSEATFHYFKGIEMFVTMSQTFTVNWIDWDDTIQDTGNTVTGGFVQSWGQIIGTLNAFMNMEPDTAKAPYTFSNNDILCPEQFRHPMSATNCFAVELWEAVPGKGSDPWKSQYKVNISDPKEQEQAVASYVITHEFGHSTDNYSTKFHNKTDWMSAYQEWRALWWNTNGQMITQDGRQVEVTYVRQFRSEYTGSLEPPLSPYGCAMPAEDFAESYACYKANPKFLEDQYPKRHAFMKKWVDSIVEV